MERRPFDCGGVRRDGELRAADPGYVELQSLGREGLARLGGRGYNNGDCRRAVLHERHVGLRHSACEASGQKQCEQRVGWHGG